MLAALTLLQASCVRAWIEVADEVQRSGCSRRRSSARPPCRSERVVRRQQLEAPRQPDGDVDVESRRHLIDPGVECGPVSAGRHHRGVRAIQRLGCGTGLRGTGDGAVLGMSLFRDRKPHFFALAAAKSQFGAHSACKHQSSRSGIEIAWAGSKFWQHRWKSWGIAKCRILPIFTEPPAAWGPCRPVPDDMRLCMAPPLWSGRAAEGPL